MKKFLLSIVAFCVCFSFIFSLTGCRSEKKSDSTFTISKAYDEAKILGFNGTLDEFIELLSGKDGIDGRDGIDGKDGADGEDGKDGNDGAPGKDGVNGKDGSDGLNGEKGEKGEPGTDGKDGVGISDVLVTTEDTDGKTYFVFTIVLSEGDPIVRKVLYPYEKELELDETTDTEATSKKMSLVSSACENMNFVPVFFVDSKFAYKPINPEFLYLKIFNEDGSSKIVSLSAEYLSPVSGTGLKTITASYGEQTVTFKAYIIKDLTEISNCATSISFDSVTLTGTDGNLFIVNSGASFADLNLTVKVTFVFDIPDIYCVYVGYLGVDIACDVENFSTASSGKASDITTITVKVGTAQNKLKFYAYVI